MAARDRYDSLLRYYAAREGLDWLDLKAQMLQESAANPKAVSPAGARGLLQFMPRTWDEWAPGEHPYDPEASIEAGAKYMAWLLKRYQGNHRQALAAYNWGIGNVQKAGADWPAKLPAETRQYLVRIATIRGTLGDRVQET